MLYYEIFAPKADLHIFFSLIPPAGKLKILQINFSCQNFIVFKIVISTPENMLLKMNKT